jgi:PAS domain S-box-containing protein
MGPIAPLSLWIGMTQFSADSRFSADSEAKAGDDATPPDPPSPLPPAVEAELQSLRQEVQRLRQAQQPQTRTKQATAIALEQDEEFIQALLNNLSEAILACDAQGKLTVYNAAAQRLLNLPATPTPGLDWTTHCTLHLPGMSTPLPVSEHPLRRAFQGESIQDWELEVQPRQGERSLDGGLDQRCTVLVNGDPIVNDLGNILGAVIALRDITPFRNATALLQEREAFLRSIYNGLKASIFVIDVVAGDIQDETEAFRYVGINTAHEQLTGLTDHSIRGKTPADILPPNLAATVSAHYRDCVAARAPITYEEAVPFQGEEQWWLTTLTPLVSDQGRIHRLIGTSLNITRRYQAEAQVQQLNRELEQRVADRTQELTQINTVLLQTTALLEKRNHELDQFVYVASHDLKAPLRAIANLANWIEEDLEGQLPAENQEQLVLLRNRVNRMEGLINGLLEYSRIGRKEFPVEPVDTQQLVAELVDSLDPPAGFTLIIPDNLPTFPTKGLLLQQVFANLISNAIKYVDRPDGHIKIAWSEQAEAYQFSVSDNGPGIDPHYHERIFAVFQVLQARDDMESTGIGLALVKKIVEGEGGIIAVQSTPGAGATFEFTWPKS